MASIDILEDDFAVLAVATLDAERVGDVGQARALDDLARKLRAALTNAHSLPGTAPIPWNMVKSLLGVQMPSDLIRRARRTGNAAVPPELADLIRQAQSHMLRTHEADAVSVKLTQYLLKAGS